MKRTGWSGLGTDGNDLTEKEPSAPVLKQNALICGLDESFARLKPNVERVALASGLPFASTNTPCKPSGLANEASPITPMIANAVLILMTVTSNVTDGSLVGVPISLGF